MITAQTTTKVQYYKSDILRILKLIHDRSEKRMTINWVTECQPFKGKTHHLLFFRYMLWFKCIRRENTPRGELYIWISNESPTQIYDSVSEMFPEYRDEVTMTGALVAKDLVECIGDVRIESKIETEPKNNIERIMKYAETKIAGFRLSDAIRDLEGQVAEKSISPILSELVTKAKKLYREHGNYYLPKYAPAGLTEYVEKEEVVSEKKVLKSHEIDILNILGDNIMKLNAILLKMPSDTNYQTLHARIKQMCSKGLLENMDRGRYRAVKKLESPKVENVIEEKSDRTLYEIQLDACNEKMEKLKAEKVRLQSLMDANEAQLKNTEEAHSALTNVINGLKALKTLNISSMN